jgi:hypothetical protein
MSASRMHRIMACPASFQLENQMPPEPPNPAAERGTHIHELAEKMFAGAMSFDNESDEDLDIASAYVSYVEKLRSHARKFHIEMSVTQALKTVHPSLGGTADAVIVKDNTLHVVDLKTGRITVKAEENVQLLTYALGAALKLSAPLNEINVEMHIWQPSNVHSWTVPGTRLRQHSIDLKRAAIIAEQPSAETNPTPEGCKYCKAKPICPAVREKVQESARLDFDLTDTSFVITPEMLDLAEEAVAWGESIQQAAKQQLKDGKQITGWQLKPGNRLKSWKDEKQAAEILKDNANAWALKSVSQVLKLGVDIDGLVEEKQSQPSLVRSK